MLTAVGGDNSVVLSASVSNTNGSDIKKWQYQQKAGGSGYGSWVDIADTGTPMSYTVTGLSNGTEYSFRVRAVNSSGNSADSDEASAVPAAVPDKPVLSGAYGDSSVVLSAVVSDDNGSDIKKWQYQQKAGVVRFNRHSHRLYVYDPHGDRPHQRHFLQSAGRERRQQR